ncbi:flagellar protein FlbD [Pseudoflavonifractor sp. 524-17]|uniref:flagellar FlbD family protein n=1 Tax=Pseudoflavonifractor sp. 524-17 TaxID=2304577 RepID=UPI00137AF4A3|nr:flagellar FlbD family protein [Pseudoflavonifractor sp. 524-17]NCE66048.1 flagellar protein FlbD [Pseudoflavonifractor sp. 524-17]
MIVLTKRSREKFLVNHLQIECIETIPETKIVMMNRDYFLVMESVDEIINKIASYNAKVQDIHREITVVDKR